MATPQVVFLHGDETFYPDGTSVRVTKLRALRGELPRGMGATYEVATDAKGRERVALTLQARSKHGRRYDSAIDENDAQARILKWSARILRELANEAKQRGQQ